MNIIDQMTIEETLTKLLRDGKITSSDGFTADCIHGRFTFNFTPNEDEIKGRIADGDFDDVLLERASDLDLYDDDDVKDAIQYGEFDDEIADKIRDGDFDTDIEERIEHGKLDDAVENRAEMLGYAKNGE